MSAGNHFPRFEKIEDAADAFFKEAKNLQTEMEEIYKSTGKFGYDYNNIKVYKSHAGGYYYLTKNVYQTTCEAPEDKMIFEFSSEMTNHTIANGN
jgi:hypothetical protein